MKTWISFSVIALLWTNTLGADPPRPVEKILEEFDAAKAPPFDGQKREDKEYIRKYLDARQPLDNKRSRLAWELYQSYPNHERAVELLLVRWENMRLDETAQALLEIGNFVNDHPDSPRIADVLYARADGALRNRRPDTAQGKAFIEDFIRKLPHDERGAELLGDLAYYSRGNPNVQRAIYRRIAADYAGTYWAKMAEGALRQLDGIGKPIELSFDDVVTGRHISMTDLRGKVVVLQFWSTTCGPCLAEMPELTAAYAKYKDQGAEFIGVNLDHPSHGVDAVKKCIADHKMTWPQYYQGNGLESEFSQSWGVNAIPTLFVVDQDGNLHSTEARGRLEFILPKLLNSQPQKN